MCVQSIFNQAIYRDDAKIAQQKRQNKMSREAPLLSWLLKLIRSMCDAIDNDVNAHILLLLLLSAVYTNNLSLKRQHWLYTSFI